MVTRTTAQRFGHALRKRRDEVGLSQAAVAERADTAVETVSRIETGRARDVGLALAERLSMAVGTTLPELLVSTPSDIQRARRTGELQVVSLLENLSDRDLDDVVDALSKLLRVRSGA